MADIKRPGAQDATGPRDAVQAGDRTAPNVPQAQSDPNFKNGNERVVSSDWMLGDHLNTVWPSSKPSASRLRLDDALALAKAKIPVFPCGHDKRPLTPHGFKDATTAEAQIRAWWERWPDARLGVPTGPASGLFVVDADVDKETGELIGENALLDQCGIDLANHLYTQRTRSGGMHAFYRWEEGLPGNTAGRISSVDSRSDGGYIVVYDARAIIAACRVDLPPLPGVLRKALAPKPPPVVSGPPPPVKRNACGNSYAEAGLINELAVLVATREGGRNHALNRAAFCLGQLVGAGLLDRDRVEAELLAAAKHIGLTQNEAQRTINSGVPAGMKYPRGSQTRNRS